jgi:hypothetical protein
MIEGNGTALAENAFEDAIEATVFMATVHVREGELTLPQRIRDHLADGPVVVHLMRGEDDVAVHEATLTSRSTLTGITWPDDVLPRTSLTVLCPRGGASHDIGVLLPNLPDEEQFVEPEDVETPDIHGELLGSEPLDEPEPAAEPMSEREAGALAFILTGLAEFEQTVFTADTEQPGPADYDVPTAPLVMTGELPTAEPTWPGDEDSEERTDLLPAVVAPDPTEGDIEPGTVFSAALVAVRTPPRHPGWLERRVRLAARWVLDRSWTATRVIVAAASGLVLAGAGLGYLVQLVVTW